MEEEKETRRYIYSFHTSKRRRSAGTLSPTDRQTVSPGTSSRARRCSRRPSRTLEYKERDELEREIERASEGLSVERFEIRPVKSCGQTLRFVPCGLDEGHILL